MRSIGVDRLVVSKVLNHAEGGITKVYDRWAADPEKMAAMERWADKLREIISGKPTDNVDALSGGQAPMSKLMISNAMRTRTSAERTTPDSVNPASFELGARPW